MCNKSDTLANSVGYCICLENGKKATFEQCIEIKSALHTITFNFFSTKQTHIFFLGDLLIILDFISKQASKLKTVFYPPTTHGKIESECLDEFCVLSYLPYKKLLRKYMTKFLVYKMDMKTTDNYYKVVVINNFELLLMYDFFMIHGLCIGNYD